MTNKRNKTYKQSLTQTFITLHMTVILSFLAFAVSADVQPRIPVFNEQTHLSYSMTKLTKAIPLAIREQIVTTLQKEKPPQYERFVAGTRARNSDRVEYQSSADYWAEPPASCRWSTNVRFKVSFTANEKKCSELLELPDTSTLSIKINPAYEIATPAPQRPSLSVFPLTSSSPELPGDLKLLMKNVPFLGFQQPGKTYKSGAVSRVKTANGWIEHCQVGDALLNQDAALTFDAKGRLVRFQRNMLQSGAYEKTYDYANFMRLATGEEIPASISVSTRSEEAPGVKPYLDTVETYTIKSVSNPKIPSELFAIDYPPSGTYIADYRFVSESSSQPLLYPYQSTLTVDAQSQAELQKRAILSHR